MNGYSAEQIRAAEAPLLAAGEPLMQRAAVGLAGVISDEVGESASILMLIGAGNNGGDALFAAAILAGAGHDVKLARTSERVHEQGIAAALDAGASETDDAVGAAEDADVIVDAILGTGGTASAALRGRARELVAALRPIAEHEDGPLVVAVDIPSGIGASDGSVPDETVLSADMTVTFGGAKAGLLIEPGADSAGDIVVVDIGLDLSGVTPTVIA
jgi:hydroxyethylthiazole kinase-like uncharacterized protein yjeF